MEYKQFKIVCTIKVPNGYTFEPREVADRIRDEIAGAVEDNRDAERDFEYVGTEVK